MPLQRSAKQAESKQERLLSTLQDFGDDPLILSGLHENMEGMRFRDMHMQGTARIIEQLCDADQFLAAGMQRMDFGLRKYVSTSALAIRNIAAGPDRYCMMLGILAAALRVFLTHCLHNNGFCTSPHQVCFQQTTK